MAFKILIGTVCTCLALITLNANAALVSAYTFQSDTTDCISEITQNCTDVYAHGLTGNFTLDLDALDGSGNGSITWDQFLNFSATNSVSNWGVTNLTDGGVTFTNWEIVDFGIKAFPDYSNAWDYSDGGGENLIIAGFGITWPVPASSGAPSVSGIGNYCNSTGEYFPESCPEDAVTVSTYGISPDYAELDIQAVPIPAAVWLFGSGLIGLIGLARRKKA
jgi:hypothetical protein